MRYFIGVIIMVVLVGGVFMFFHRDLEDITSIEAMSFGYSTGTAYLADVSYEIVCEDTCRAIIKPVGVEEENAKEVEISDKTIQEILSILNTNEVASWDGFQKSDLNVLDGNSFHFYLTEKGGRHISASGYMKYPKNYRDVKDALDEIFSSL